MNYRHTPPYSTPNTPEIGKGTLPITVSTPHSIIEGTLTPTLNIPKDLSRQQDVEADPQLKRWQQDLLVLTGFVDNSTLHWRPSWFEREERITSRFWTLHNPPNVVTELLPLRPLGRPVATRRMRRPNDPPAEYIKSWEHWSTYCEMYGVPGDFLCEDHIRLMRLGLPKSHTGELIMAPTHPLYPEPQPLGRGRYVLDREHHRNLPRKFHTINDDEVIIVHSNGALEVAQSEALYFHASQWSHYNGKGEYVDDWWYDADPDVLKIQGKGRRWSYLPWTKEQERSCRPMILKLKLNPHGNDGVQKLHRVKKTAPVPAQAASKTSKALLRLKALSNHPSSREGPERLLGPQEELNRAYDLEEVDTSKAVRDAEASDERGNCQSGESENGDQREEIDAYHVNVADMDNNMGDDRKSGGLE